MFPDCANRKPDLGDCNPSVIAGFNLSFLCGNLVVDSRA